jgi:hypothetical protein
MKTRDLANWVPYLVMALPVCSGFSYVYLFGVDVVWNDEWDLVNLSRGIASGGKTVWDLWEPHNEHRFVFPGIAVLLLAALTQWNTLAEMYLIQVCLLVTLVALLLTFRASVVRRPLFFVPVAFLVFSLVQGFNMLWGLQLTFIFVETFGVLTFCFLYLLGRGARKRFALPAALTTGTIAAFSAIQGLIVWPVGLLQLFVIPLERSKKMGLMAVWGLVGLVEWVAYFIGFETGPDSPSVLHPLSNPLAGAKYFVTLLGSSLSYPRWESFTFVGGLLLASLVAVSLLLIFTSGKVEEYSFWLALLLFSLFILAAITVGRSEAQGLPAGRYANFSVLAAVGVYAVLAKSFLENRSRAVVALFGTLCVVLVLSVPVSYFQGTRIGVGREHRAQQSAYILYTHSSQSDECLKLVRRSNTHTVERLAPEMEELDLSVFSGPPISPPPNLRSECRL